MNERPPTTQWGWRTPGKQDSRMDIHMNPETVAACTGPSPERGVDTPSLVQTLLLVKELLFSSGVSLGK